MADKDAFKAKSEDWVENVWVSRTFEDRNFENIQGWYVMMLWEKRRPESAPFDQTVLLFHPQGPIDTCVSSDLLPVEDKFNFKHLNTTGSSRRTSVRIVIMWFNCSKDFLCDCSQPDQPGSNGSCGEITNAP